MGFTDLEATMKKYVGERMYEFRAHERTRMRIQGFRGGVIGQNLHWKVWLSDFLSSMRVFLKTLTQEQLKF